MAQDTVTKALGLVNQYNPLSTSPGALIQADDCVIRREHIIENRRGYATYGTLSNTPTQLLIYNKKVVAHNSTTVSYDNGSGTFANYSGSYTAPTNYKMRGVEAVSNLYVTTSSGVKVFTDLAGTAARSAGAPRSLDPSYTLTGASGFLADGFQCAYRVVIQRTDANSNSLYGYPSTRLVAYNTTGGGTSKNIALTLYLPSEVTTSDVIQFYRTHQVSGTTSDLSGDEMGLVYQVNPSSTDISNGYITFTDSIIDDLIGASLYTSPSQEGIAQGNDRPPLCKDIALYKSQYLFYANTSTKQRMFVTMVGTASLSAKTITLAGVTYNFGATEIVSGGGSPQAKVYSGGTTVAVDIDNTARSLVRVINRYAGNTAIYAYYISGSDDLPGQILLEEKGIGASAFTIQASDTAISGMFFPAPPVSPATSTQSTSSNQIQKNALYYSKAQQPEHVPALNYIPVGPANKEIVRIVALRDSLIIIKEEGVYRLTGETDANFSVVPLDLTVFCKSADSVATLANQVFMLSNQGVVSITDGGVQVTSREIEPSIIPLLSVSGIADKTYGCAYQSERSYFLSTVASSADTSPTQIFVYNTFTRSWTRWTFGFTSAIVEDAADRLYLTKADQDAVYRERKDFTTDDYADPESAITITALSGTTITFTLGGDAPDVGWVVSQGGTEIPIGTPTDLGGGSYTAELQLDPPVTWAPGAGTIYPSIPMTIVYDAWSAQAPGLMKHGRQVEILTDNISGNANHSNLYATFLTDLDGTVDEVEIVSQSSRWGAAPWGISVWGGIGDTYAFPTYFPRNKQYFRLLNFGVKHNRAHERMAIAGFALTFEPISERTSR